MPTPIQQDEEDVVRYSDSPAAPLAPPVASPPNVRTQQPVPAALPGSLNGSPAPVISQAVGQLNAGQPVTALPHQDWSLQQATAFNAKLDAFDQQAKHARIAADQAARDAHLFEQMSRVAKSTKDIEIALQQQDVMGFRNAVASGMPGYQALQRFPRAATSPLVAAMHAAQPVAQPTWVPQSGDVPAHFTTASGQVHFPPRVPVLKSTDPTAAQEISALRARAALKEQQFIVANPKKGSPEEKAFLQALTDIDKRLEELSSGGSKQVPTTSPRGTSAPAARIRVKRKSDGKVFTYPGAAADVPSTYEVLP